MFVLVNFVKGISLKTMGGVYISRSGSSYNYEKVLVVWRMQMDIFFKGYFIHTSYIYISLGLWIILNFNSVQCYLQKNPPCVVVIHVLGHSS